MYNVLNTLSEYTYQKTSLYTLLLLVSKIIESLKCILTVNVGYCIVTCFNDFLLYIYIYIYIHIFCIRFIICKIFLCRQKKDVCAVIKYQPKKMFFLQKQVCF